MDVLTGGANGRTVSRVIHGQDHCQGGACANGLQTCARRVGRAGGRATRVSCARDLRVRARTQIKCARLRPRGSPANHSTDRSMLSVHSHAFPGDLPQRVAALAQMRARPPVPPRHPFGPSGPPPPVRRAIQIYKLFAPSLPNWPFHVPHSLNINCIISNNSYTYTIVDCSARAPTRSS